MNIFKQLIDFVGVLTTIYAVLMFFVSITFWVIGIGPLLYRLGFARWKRKVHIVSDAQTFSELKTDLTESGVFREKNIINISASHLSSIKESNLVLVHYPYLSDEQIQMVLSNKRTSAGFIFYFPEFTPSNRISDETLRVINGQAFTTIVNFRGRLINDLVVTMLSTSFKK